MVPNNMIRHGRLLLLFFALGSWELGGAIAGAPGAGPVKVQVEYEKEERAEVAAPLDATPRMQLRSVGSTFSMFMTDEMGRRLHLGHFPTLKIDGSIVVPGPSALQGKWEVLNAPLPKKGGKDRVGYMKVWVKDNVRITQTVELTPSKTLVDGKRRLDAALIRYTLENTGSVPHTVGLRTCIDSFLINQRNCKFAAPTRPGKLLDGVELKDRDVPPYVQVLQMPDLKNPGTVAHITLAMGSGLERPDRVVLTGIQGRRDLWDLPIMAGGFSSALGFFWEPKEIRPGSKRELAYAYGLGLAAPLSPDANFAIQLGGSFERGKVFSIAAIITDPGEGQSLELDLPKGLQLMEGKQIQPVPPGEDDVPLSMVLWKGRVVEYGQFPIRIRSNAGVTKTAKVTIGPG